MRADALSAPAVVVDTNRVLDVWLFHDPSTAALEHALCSGTMRWLATPAMRAELARVLGYPAIVRQLEGRRVAPATVLAAFGAHARLVAPGPRAPVACRDPDDQMFLDLALAHHADLYSRDRALLELARRLLPLGVRVVAGDCPREIGAPAEQVNNARQSSA